MTRRLGRKPLPRTTRLFGESLEVRQLLDASGAIWNIDAHQYTISFADDGTNVGPKQSALHTELAHLGAPEVWQEAIVRGFQTWAKHTDVDLTVVDDDGTDFGVGGNANRDPRFGDIRVAAIPFKNNVSAESISTDQPDAGTWTGDFILNTNAHLGTLDDLYTIALHEAGHVFGLEHSDDIDSPMYGLSTPTSTTPTSADLAALDNIYGGRSPDFFDDMPVHHPTEPELEPEEEHTDLDEDPDETVQLQLDQSTSNAPTLIFGDIQSSEDVDAYQASEISDAKQLIAITLLTEDISLLRPTLNVKTAEGGVLASVPFSDRTEAGQVVFLQDLGSVDHRNLVIEVVSSQDVAPYDAGGYTLVLQQADTDNLPDEVPELTRCVDALAHSSDRSHTPSSLNTYLGTCQRFVGGSSQALIDLINGNNGQDPTIGIEPVDPTEASFCGFDWLDDLFSCIVWGDLNGDGKVTFADFLKLSVNFGSQDADPEDGDIDDDGAVGFSDFLILSRNFGEPVTFSSIDDVDFFP